MFKKAIPKKAGKVHVTRAVRKILKQFLRQKNIQIKHICST